MGIGKNPRPEFCKCPYCEPVPARSRMMMSMDRNLNLKQNQEHVYKTLGH